MASEVVQAHTSREAARRKEVQEFATIYDMQRPHPGDYARKPEGWQQKLRPEPRGLELSQYEREMINYQRMFLRRNIWYYRDRASVPRGPCPLHVLKSAWVSGIIDENTLVWGHGLFDWLPAKNVKLLLPMIRTPEGESASQPHSASALQQHCQQRRAPAGMVVEGRAAESGRCCWRRRPRACPSALLAHPQGSFSCRNCPFYDRLALLLRVGEQAGMDGRPGSGARCMRDGPTAPRVVSHSSSCWSLTTRTWHAR